MPKSATGPERDELARLAAEWASFTGWLHVSSGREDDALQFFTTTDEITDELEDGQLATTATSYKGYVALLQGHHARRYVKPPEHSPHLAIIQRNVFTISCKPPRDTPNSRT